jgi:hypothetical protein
MIGETKAFFSEVLNEGLTLREFLNSKWSMINEPLSKHYGLGEWFEKALAAELSKRTATRGSSDTDNASKNDPLSQPEFIRVTLPPDSHRGGLLTQASILSLTSDGVRHRPVHRGVWLSESIFGKTPPPPPANVNPIPTNPTGPKATLREKLEAHVHDANCAACHVKIDPLGLAFENYDAIGRWRTEEITDGIGDNPRVRSSGRLPDGREYQNAEEFKQLLLGDLDAFTLTLVEKIATYGLRRSMTLSDRDELKGIALKSKESDYRLRDLIQAFVTSNLFQMR